MEHTSRNSTRNSMDGIPLDFEKKSLLEERKEELKREHHEYMRQHPELKQILSDFMSHLLITRPDDIFSFTTEYFSTLFPSVREEVLEQRRSRASSRQSSQHPTSNSVNRSTDPSRESSRVSSRATNDQSDEEKEDFEITNEEQDNHQIQHHHDPFYAEDADQYEREQDEEEDQPRDTEPDQVGEQEGAEHQEVENGESSPYTRAEDSESDNQEFEVDLTKMHRPLVICGPSGVGKGTLIEKLLKEFPDRFAFSVSNTTRGPRPGEIDGVHYHFTERSVMEKMIEENKFIETAHVHGNIYGTSFASVKAVMRTGRICVLDIDVQGAFQVKEKGLNPLMIFIAPPSLELLEQRLRGRGTETEDKIQLRTANARKEMEYASSFDFVVVNDDLERAYQELKDIIFTEI